MGGNAFFPPSAVRESEEESPAILRKTFNKRQKPKWKNNWEELEKSLKTHTRIHTHT